MEKILLYGSPGCPRCAVLRKTMEKNGIEFEETHDIDELVELGYQQLPILRIGEDKFLVFKDALDYVRNLEAQ